MKRFLTELFGSAVAVAFFASVAHATCPQPVYIIPHRCNRIDDVYNVVSSQGVNAVEGDFMQIDGTWYLKHGGIWDSEPPYPLDPWLDNVKQTIDRSQKELALIVLDIKTPEGNLLSLYNKMRGKLGNDINLIFSVGDFEDAVDHYFQSGFLDKLDQDPRAGSAIDYLVGDDENQVRVNNLFIDNDVKKYWFADGLCAGCVETESVEKNVKKGMALRRSFSVLACDTSFHGVYTWTYEDAGRIGEYLRKSMDSSGIAGVNGIMVNASECYGFAWSGVDPKIVVAFVKNAGLLTGTQLADRRQNPFRVPAPEIACPPSTTVECSAPGGVNHDDPQLEAFFHGANIDTRGCDAVGDAEIDTPAFFYLNGTADVTFTAADESPCRPSNSCLASVTVVDTTAPTITKITATPGTLWPPNGKMVPVSLDVTIDDSCDAAPACQITSVTSSQPEYGTGSGKRAPDWTIVGDLQLHLRAERPGKDGKRVYSVTVACNDASGNSTQGAVEIVVPHDQRHGATVRLSSKRRR